MTLRATLVIAALAATAGCGVSPSRLPDPQPLEQGRLPAPNAALTVAHLRPCTDSPDATLRLNTGQPVTVLVHGCKGSAGQFRSLAQLFAFHGQQAVCFSYDDRESLVRSSARLIAALDELSGRMPGQELAVLGHSMGGLVARKAMERDRRVEWRNGEARIKLATVSAPLSGIQAANHCGLAALQWLSLGAVPGVCWIVTGANWSEINPHSSFIRRPGPLLASVERYVKVITDERNTCRRRRADGSCRESDYVFSLAEQSHPAIEAYPQTVRIEVEAGHVEIVGDKDVAPRKLLGILQEQGLLAPTPPGRRAALERLLAELY